MARKREPAPAKAVQAEAQAKPARVKPAPQPASDDPLALLRYDHRMLESLFSQFVLRKDARVAQRICDNLTSHAALEDTFYAEAETIPELHGRVEAAMREHGAMAELATAVRSLAEGEALNEQMLALRQAVEQHIRDEERSIFAAVMKSMSRHRLRDLGAALRAAKDKLSEGERAVVSS